MYHVIKTHFDGFTQIYGGPELTPLIITVLEMEFDVSPADWTDPDPEYDPAVLQAFTTPSLETLRKALEYIGIDMTYSSLED